jgi:biotin carboxylase
VVPDSVRDAVRPPVFLVMGWKPGLTEVLRRFTTTAVVVMSPADVARSRGLGDEPPHVLVVGDPTDPADVCTALLRGEHADRTVLGVAALSEKSVVPAALVSAALGVPGPPVAVAITARDKHLQKSRIRSAGIPVARTAFVAAESDVDLRGVVAACGGFPVVVKPVSGVGANSTCVARDETELRQALDRIRPSSHGARGVLVEEFVTGAEHHLDGYLVDGRIQLLSVSRYTTNVLAALEENLVQSIVVNPGDEPDLHERAGAFAGACLAAMGVDNSVFHLEFFVTEDGELVFSECGARPGGGFIAQAVAAKYGVDLREVALRLAAREPVPAPGAIGSGSVGFTFLSARSGVIAARPSDEDVLALPGVLRVLLPYGAGDEVPDASSSSGMRLGLALARGESYEDLRARLDAAVGFVWDHTTVTAAP